MRRENCGRRQRQQRRPVILNRHPIGPLPSRISRWAATRSRCAERMLPGARCPLWNCWSTDVPQETAGRVAPFGVRTLSFFGLWIDCSPRWPTGACSQLRRTDPNACVGRIGCPRCARIGTGRLARRWIAVVDQVGGTRGRGTRFQLRVHHSVASRRCTLFTRNTPSIAGRVVGVMGQRSPIGPAKGPGIVGRGQPQPQTL